MTQQKQQGFTLIELITGNAVNSVAVGTGGIITITYNNKVASGTTIILTPTVNNAKGSITWTCTAGTVDDKYKPANCR